MPNNEHTQSSKSIFCLYSHSTIGVFVLCTHEKLSFKLTKQQTESFFLLILLSVHVQRKNNTAVAPSVCYEILIPWIPSHIPQSNDTNSFKLCFRFCNCPFDIGIVHFHTNRALFQTLGFDKGNCRIPIKSIRFDRFSILNIFHHIKNSGEKLCLVHSIYEFPMKTYFHIQHHLSMHWNVNTLWFAECHSHEPNNVFVNCQSATNLIRIQVCAHFGRINNH